MQMQDVNSSTIARVGHDPLRHELHVDFKSGGTYIYHNVPASEFRDLLAASSIGKHFAANVKNAFHFTRK